MANTITLKRHVIPAQAGIQKLDPPVTLEDDEAKMGFGIQVQEYN